jgi:hypothetical protein
MPAHLAHRPSFCGLLVNERGKAGATPGVQISGFPRAALWMKKTKLEAEIVLKALNFWACKSKMTRSSGILISAWSFARAPQSSIQRSAKMRDDRCCRRRPWRNRWPAKVPPRNSSNARSPPSTMPSPYNITTNCRRIESVATSNQLNVNYHRDP